MEHMIRGDHLKDLRLVAKKLDGIHDGCAVIVESICDYAEKHSIVTDD